MKAKQTIPENPDEKPAPPRWQVTAFQLLFGAMAVALGGFISAEPTLSLDRGEDGRLVCRYALNAYGRFPALEHSVDDLIRYEVTESRSSGVRATGSSSSGRGSTSYTLTVWGRDGSHFSVGQSWSLTALDGMIDGSHEERSSRQRITAGGARRYGGLGLGTFGLLLLAGAVWNGFLIVTRFASPTDRIAHG